jgi:hypothetical protein
METANEEQVAAAAGIATRPMTEPELKALTKDLQEVLVKHNAEMGVTSSINLMKVIDNQDDSKTPESVEETKEETDTEAEKGS